MRDDVPKIAPFRFFRRQVKSRHDMKSAPRRSPNSTAIRTENPADWRGFLFLALCFANEAFMNSEQQALVEAPIWMVIVLSLVGGVSGEMWRADKAGVRGWPLVRRIALRSGACIVCGLSTNMLLYSAGLSIWTAGGLGCLTAMAGADVAIGLYERWAAKRLGVCEMPPRNGEPGQ